MRETIKTIRDSGGVAILITQGARHTRIHFTGHDGRRLMVLIPQGHASSRIAAGIRAKVRRLIRLSEREAANPRADADAPVPADAARRSIRKSAAA